MTDPDDRFDALLEAMLTKPPLDDDAQAEGDEDLREPEED